MNDNLNWYSYRKLAEALQKKYPDTDTLDLSDETLGEMLYGLDMTKGFPAMPEKDKKDIFLPSKSLGRKSSKMMPITTLMPMMLTFNK